VAELYANENVPFPVVAELRTLGHDVLTTLEVGKARQSFPDEQVLKLAIAPGRALVTLNLKHFIRLHTTHSHHCGIIVCSFDPDFVGQAQRMHAAIESNAPLAEKLIRVNRPA
jgi:Domain of unknown function (DUF5615)